MHKAPHANGTELIVALDFPRAEKALSLVEKLDGLSVIYKVGLELFLAGGPELVLELVHRKQRIFLDLKFYDIPRTVAQAAKQAALLHVEMLTLHLAGGNQMIREVVAGFFDMPILRPKILGVSVLTSFDDVKWAEVTKALNGHAVNTSESVLGLVSSAATQGIDGIVCSPMELAMIRSRFPTLYTVVPGIRPAGAAKNDQARIATPAFAAAMGAHAIVVGRPICEAKDPRLAVESILKEIVEAITNAPVGSKPKLV